MFGGSEEGAPPFAKCHCTAVFGRQDGVSAGSLCAFAGYKSKPRTR